nr:hypothetical protein CFP56_04256 [Quercus suber]
MIWDQVVQVQARGSVDKTIGNSGGDSYTVPPMAPRWAPGEGSDCVTCGDADRCWRIEFSHPGHQRGLYLKEFPSPAAGERPETPTHCLPPLLLLQRQTPSLNQPSIRQYTSAPQSFTLPIFILLITTFRGHAVSTIRTARLPLYSAVQPISRFKPRSACQQVAGIDVPRQTALSHCTLYRLPRNGIAI